MAKVGLRSYEVQTLGGDPFVVDVPSGGTVRDLRAQLWRSGRATSYFFSMFSEDGCTITSEAGPLPAGARLTLVFENPSPLCAAAQRVLSEASLDQAPQGLAAQLHLGRCCDLGTFGKREWPEDDAEVSDCDWEEIEKETGNPWCAQYHVCELELLDGDDAPKKLVAVISEGHANREIPKFGAVYLRPDFKKVASLRGMDELWSKWFSTGENEDEPLEGWYKDLDAPLPTCCNYFGGGHWGNAPWKMHLTHALAVALGGRSALSPTDADKFREEEGRRQNGATGPSRPEYGGASPSSFFRASEPLHGTWDSGKGKCCIQRDSVTARLAYTEDLADGQRLHGWLDPVSGDERLWSATLAVLEADEKPWYGPSFGPAPEAVGNIRVRLLDTSPPSLETQIKVAGEDEDFQDPTRFNPA